MADTGKPVVVCKALQLANEERIVYGLRYNDFSRYRKHCANRTHRLRSSLKMTHGKGREFKKLPPLNLDNLRDGHLQLLLLEAERAWAYAQELITLSLQPANEIRASMLRHSATGRFRRSVNWSTQLLSHSQTLFMASRLSAENLIQVTIYTLILNGRFLRYRDEFEDALIQLSIARGLLDELAAGASNSRDQALATLFSDDIGPEIRYCAHELGRPKAYEIDGIIKELMSKHRHEIVEGYDALVEKLRTEGEAPGKAESRKKLGVLLWEGQPVPVRNPELVDVLLKVQEADARLNSQYQNTSGESTTVHGKMRAKHSKGIGSKKGVAAYDAILLALSDAEDVARKLVEAQRLSGTNTGTVVEGTRDIQFVHAYIVYQLLSRRIERDLLLISTILSSQSTPDASPSTRPSTSSPKADTLTLNTVDSRLFPAVVKLLDTVLQSLSQMRTLSIVDESPDLASSVEARISFTKARRCFYLARCYAPVRRYAEALTLIQHANIYLRETVSTLSLSDSDPISSGSPSYYPLANIDFNKLENDLTSDGGHFKKDWFNYNGGTSDVDAKAYKKPLFFNIALNYVQLDMDRLQERAGKQDVTSPTATLAKGKTDPTSEKKQGAKARIEEITAVTPEPQAPTRGGLSGLLGGWWGKN